MARGRKRHLGRVFMRQHREHAPHRQRGALVDPANTGVRMRRTQQLDVLQALDCDVEREARLAGDDIGTGGGGDVVSDAFAVFDVFDVAFAGNGVVDGAIAGAAAQVAFHRARQIGALRLIERSGGHDHAGGAEAALETLRVEKGALHRMQLVALSKPFDGCDLAAVGAEGRHQTGMHRLAIEIDGAGAAIAGVAAFLDAEMAELAQEGAQALSGGRRVGEGLAVDGEGHRAAPVSSSRMLCAKCSVMCRRQAGAP